MKTIQAITLGSVTSVCLFSLWTFQTTHPPGWSDYDEDALRWASTEYDQPGKSFRSLWYQANAWATAKALLEHGFQWALLGAVCGLACHYLEFPATSSARAENKGVSPNVTDDSSL